jgi:ribosome hibernation promoting factor
MNIIIQTPDFKPSGKLIRFVNKKVEVLDRFHDHIIDSQVYLKKIKSSKPQNKVCEIRLGIPGNDMFASKRGNTFEDAITNAIETIKRQIGDRKAENRVNTPL